MQCRNENISGLGATVYYSLYRASLQPISTDIKDKDGVAMVFLTKQIHHRGRLMSGENAFISLSNTEERVVNSPRRLSFPFSILCSYEIVHSRSCFISAKYLILEEKQSRST